MSDFSIRFREMSDDEFNTFVEYSVLDYSKNLIKSGEFNEENALESAKEQFNQILTNGKYTEDNYINIVVNNENENVGIIWYKKYKEGVAFICDFLIYENYRRKGYGKQALLLLENEVKEKEMNKILLHVFKFNETAISLYSGVGYKVVQEGAGGMHMIKNI